MLGNGDRELLGASFPPNKNILETGGNERKGILNHPFLPGSLRLKMLAEWGELIPASHILRQLSELAQGMQMGLLPAQVTRARSLSTSLCLPNPG